MNRYLKSLLFVFVSLTQFSFSQCFDYRNTSCCEPMNECCSDFNVFSCLDRKWSAEFRVAYFHPESKRLKKIYVHNFVDYQLEASTNIRENWDLWLDVCYLSKKGYSDPLKDKTRIYLIPIALGLSYDLFCWNDWKAYAGAGINYSYLRIHDHSNYVKENIKKWNVGGTFKLGVKTEFCNGFTVDLFCDYFLQKFNFHNHNYSSYYVERNDLNASGIKAGVGIGYAF